MPRSIIDVMKCTALTYSAFLCVFMYDMQMQKMFRMSSQSLLSSVWKFQNVDDSGKNQGFSTQNIFVRSIHLKLCLKLFCLSFKFTNHFSNVLVFKQNYLNNYSVSYCEFENAKISKIFQYFETFTKSKRLIRLWFCPLVSIPRVKFCASDSGYGTGIH